MATPEITHETLNAKLDANGLILQELRAEVLRRIEMIEDTFPLDDRGRPDYHLVKEHHTDVRESKKAMNEYKRAITLRLLQGAVGLLITILGFGLGPYFSKILGG